MLSETLENLTTTLNQIDITDEPGSEKYDIFVYKPYVYKLQPILPRQQLKCINFEQYVKKHFKNKIQIFNRDTFHYIKKPIVIAFNHFRAKCAYHTKWLDRLYKLSLKYGDRIEFLVADMFDLDILYPGRNPITFFSRLAKSEDVTLSIYTINEKKEIYQHFDAYNTEETLMELCVNLLNGTLYPSLPLLENNQASMIKICVHDNYEELILKSHKNIFLIINVESYQFHQYEPNYYNIAKTLKNYNLDVVYMEAEKNYIPFEYHVSYYPTLIYIPHNNKKDFVYYDEPREEKTIIEYLKNIMENAEFLRVQQQNFKSQILCKTIQVPKDFQIEFNDLKQLLENNFNNSLKILNRNIVESTKDTVILVFMDFQGKCLQDHIYWLNKIYQVAENDCTFQYFIADFKDIDIINTRWQPQDLIENSKGKPKIFGFDYLKHTYEMKNFASIAQLFYFTESVQNCDFYYSQVYSRNNLQQAVKEWTANYFNIFLKNTKKNIFIAFYSSDDEKCESVLNLLELLAYDVKDMNVEIVKFNVKWNYVDLEYAQTVYPALYCIPIDRRRNSRFFKDSNLNRIKILNFIKDTIE